MKKCPRCYIMKMNDEKVFNSLSRRDGKTYICNDCGDEEAMIDIGEMKPDKIELEFVKTHNRRFAEE